MKKQIIDEFVSNNRFLLVPRLVNQKLFDELCPVKQFHRRRKWEISPLTVALDVSMSLRKLHHLPVFVIDRYCVLLVTGEEEQFVSVNEAFFDFASSNTKEVLRFAYVYQRQQQPLCDALLKKEDTTPPQVRDIHVLIHTLHLITSFDALWIHTSSAYDFRWFSWRDAALQEGCCIGQWQVDGMGVMMISSASTSSLRFCKETPPTLPMMPCCPNSTMSLPL